MALAVNLVPTRRGKTRFFLDPWCVGRTLPITGFLNREGLGNLISNQGAKG